MTIDYAKLHFEFLQSGMSVNEALIIGIVSIYEKGCFLSNTAFSETLCVQPRIITRYISNLVKNNYLKKEMNSNSNGRVLYLTDLSISIIENQNTCIKNSYLKQGVDRTINRSNDLGGTISGSRGVDRMIVGGRSCDPLPLDRTIYQREYIDNNIDYIKKREREDNLALENQKKSFSFDDVKNTYLSLYPETNLTEIEKFYNYYAMVGWKNKNNQQITDLSCCIKNWEVRKKEREPQPKFIKQYKDKTLEDFTTSAKAQLMQFAESREQAIMERKK